MKKNILYLLSLFFVMGCKDYLEVKTYGKAIPTTAEEFSALLHNHLNNLDYGGDFPLLENASDLLSMESLTDNFSVALTTPSGNVLPKYIGDLINQKQSRYDRLYAVIRDANIIINNLSPIHTDQERQVMGTAHALRAIAYYHLLREYAAPFERESQPGVPIVTDFDMEERPLRSTYGAAMRFIEEEFTRAISYEVTDEIYRYTTDVVKAYRARYYFWTKQWEKAATLSAELLQAYPLVEGATYVEMMQSRNSATGNVLLRSYLFRGGHDAAFTNAQMLIKTRPLKKDFVDLFEEGARDIRFDLSFDRKRLTQKTLIGKVRSAEFQLILAESYAHLGQSDEALSAINMLRAKRITNVTAYTLESLPAVDQTALIQVDAEGKPLSPLLQLILNERRKELFAEGDRFFELKRNGKPEFWAAQNGLKYTTRAYMYTFPLPRIDIELIPGLEQNEGYEF